MTAQQIIEKFRPYASAFDEDADLNSRDGETVNAIKCSIVYVEGLIELHDLNKPEMYYDTWWERTSRELTALLNELKAMV